MSGAWPTSRFSTPVLASPTTRSSSKPPTPVLPHWPRFAAQRQGGPFKITICDLTTVEAKAVQRSRSQAVILKRGENIKYAPLAFTEHGALMAASVLNSPRAVEMSVFVVRAFVRLRELVADHTVLAAKLRQLERRVAVHDRDLLQIIEAIRQLMEPTPRGRKRIGFSAEEVSADHASPP